MAAILKNAEWARLGKHASELLKRIIECKGKRYFLVIPSGIYRKAVMQLQERGIVLVEQVNESFWLELSPNAISNLFTWMVPDDVPQWLKDFTIPFAIFFEPMPENLQSLDNGTVLRYKQTPFLYAKLYRDAKSINEPYVFELWKGNGSELIEISGFASLRDILEIDKNFPISDFHKVNSRASYGV